MVKSLFIGFDVSRERSKGEQIFYIALIMSLKLEYITSTLRKWRKHLCVSRLHFRELNKKQKITLLRLIKSELPSIKKEVIVLGFILKIPKKINKRQKKKGLARVIANELFKRINTKTLRITCCSDLDDKKFIFCSALKNHLEKLSKNRLKIYYEIDDLSVIVEFSDVISNFLRLNSREFVKNFYVKFHSC